MRFILTHFFIVLLYNLVFVSIGNANKKLPNGNCLKSISNQQKTNLVDRNISIEFITHSTFKITSPKGVSVVVDFAGNKADKAPNIITLNHTQKNKLIYNPSLKTKIILQAWSSKTNLPLQHVVLKEDVSVQNFQTHLYKDGVLEKAKGNSIFVFKIAGLCIAHLGNIQHALDDEQKKSINNIDIGKIDIVMAPVSGRDQFTTQALATLLTRLNAKIIIPMHWKNDTQKQDFMADISPYFSISSYPTKAIKVSTNTLPKTPTIVTMIPKYEQNEAEFNKHH